MVSPKGDILEQGDALDTVGEAIFLRLLLPPLRAGARLLVVTSDFHAARAERIFRFVYGTNFELAFEAVPNGPEHETPSACQGSGITWSALTSYFLASTPETSRRYCLGSGNAMRYITTRGMPSFAKGRSLHWRHQTDLNDLSVDRRERNPSMAI